MGVVHGDAAGHRFSRTRLRVVPDDFPAPQRRLPDLACNELAAAQAQMLLLGRTSARERVASFLVARCHADAHHALFLPMPRADIADYLGLTIETVSRTLTRLLPVPSQHLIGRGKRHLEPDQSGTVAVVLVFLRHVRSEPHARRSTRRRRTRRNRCRAGG